MSRLNIKDDELVKFAELMMTADDYKQRIQRLNGIRMGLTNRYRDMKENEINSLTKMKRLNLWKELVDAYK